MTKLKISTGTAIRKILRALRRYSKGGADAIRKAAAGKLRLSHTPEHLLSAADTDRGTIRIRLMDAETYTESVRLDAARPRDFHSKGFGAWDVAFKDLKPLTDSITGLGEADLGIISHPGFCGSTLMANMLGALPSFFVYREPVVWRGITDLLYEPDLAHKYTNQQRDDISLAVLRLFSRTWLPRQKSVVKSIPGSMGLDLYAQRLVPSIHYVYLCPGLESYLASIFKNGDYLFPWIDGQLSHEWLWLHTEDKGLRADLRSLPRHLRAALHWRMHSAVMAHFSSSQPGAVMTIPSDEFFEDTVGVIQKVSAHFGRQPDQDEIQSLRQSSIGNYHSKERSRKYNDEDRKREEGNMLSRHRVEIDEATSWLAGEWSSPTAVSQAD